MGRMPYHIHLLLYRTRKKEPEFALFQRADLTQIWQGVCGGGEAGESVLETVHRECREEAGIARLGPVYHLDAISVMRSTVFAKESKRWGKDTLVLPMYFFAAPWEGEVTLSDEHLDMRWLGFESGFAQMKSPDQALALWELSERLKRGNLERATPERYTIPWSGLY